MGKLGKKKQKIYYKRENRNFWTLLRKVKKKLKRNSISFNDVFKYYANYLYFHIFNYKQIQNHKKTRNWIRSPDLCQSAFTRLINLSSITYSLDAIPEVSRISALFIRLS